MNTKVSTTINQGAKKDRVESSFLCKPLFSANVGVSKYLKILSSIHHKDDVKKTWVTLAHKVSSFYM